MAALFCGGFGHVFRPGLRGSATECLGAECARCCERTDPRCGSAAERCTDRERAARGKCRAQCGCPAAAGARSADLHG